jgi:DNA invertase Pin-like site-specific DNA recombinase
MSANQKRQETMRRKKQIQRGEVTLRLWAVARVSLPGKGVQFGSLDQQQNMIQRWAETEFGEKGIKFEITRLIDEERSGRKEKVHLRRDLKEIRKAMVEKSIDGVIFEKICRIMRSKSDFFEFLEFSRKHGCQVFTIEDGDIDSDVRGKSLITAIKATMAEDYSDELAEKICKKQREAKVNNGKDSSTKPVLGLDPDGNFRGFYKVNEQERVIVLDIFNCFNANGNLKKTASYCNEKGYKTKEWVTAEKFNRYGERVPSRKMGGEAFDSRRLRELLANDKYLGCSSFIDHLNQFPAMQDEDGRVFWSYKHGPVVPESTFIRAQELLEKIRRRHVSASSKRVYLLSGILSDNKGRMYQGNSAKSGDYLYYKLKDSLFLIPKEEIEKIVIDRMKMQLTENSSFKKLLCSVSQRGDTLLKNLRDKLKETRKYKFEKEKKLGEFDEIIRKEVLSKQGEAVKVVSYFLELQKKDEAEIVALKEQEAALEKEIDLLQSSLKTTELNSILSQAMKSFDKKDDHQKRMILQGLIKNVIVLSNSKIEIIYSGSLLEGSRHSGETSVRLERKWRERRDSNPRPSA